MILKPFYEYDNFTLKHKKARFLGMSSFFVSISGEVVVDELPSAPDYTGATFDIDGYIDGSYSWQEPSLPDNYSYSDPSDFYNLYPNYEHLWIQGLDNLLDIYSCSTAIDCTSVLIKTLDIRNCKNLNSITWEHGKNLQTFVVSDALHGGTVLIQDITKDIDFSFKNAGIRSLTFNYNAGITNFNEPDLTGLETLIFYESTPTIQSITIQSGIYPKYCSFIGTSSLTSLDLEINSVTSLYMPKFGAMASIPNIDKQNALSVVNLQNGYITTLPPISIGSLAMDSVYGVSEIKHTSSKSCSLNNLPDLASVEHSLTGAADNLYVYYCPNLTGLFSSGTGLLSVALAGLGGSGDGVNADFSSAKLSSSFLATNCNISSLQLPETPQKVSNFSLEHVSGLTHINLAPFFKTGTVQIQYCDTIEDAGLSFTSGKITTINLNNCASYTGGLSCTETQTSTIRAENLSFFYSSGNELKYLYLQGPSPMKDFSLYINQFPLMLDLTGFSNSADLNSFVFEIPSSGALLDPDDVTIYIGGNIMSEFSLNNLLKTISGAAANSTEADFYSNRTLNLMGTTERNAETDEYIDALSGIYGFTVLKDW